MNDHDIERVVDAVLARQTAPAAIEQAAEKALLRLLQAFGIDEDDHKEIRRDLAHLRRWRLSVDRATTVGFGTAITVLVGGLFGSLWLGIKATLGK